ncbi:MAG: hypothetical protein HY817_05840 [Candidatus Abawacabacteria bacterium]|nr:hypothetical protein [Candidatus Abawacabacteria bacterium]
MYKSNVNTRVSLVINGLGWIGVIAILLAYFLVNGHYIEIGNALYFGLNFGGAIALMIEAFYKTDYQPMVLNFIWAGIALVSII